MGDTNTFPIRIKTITVTRAIFDLLVNLAFYPGGPISEAQLDLAAESYGLPGDGSRVVPFSAVMAELDTLRDMIVLSSKLERGVE
ncbi:hypothetical protein [Geothrix sp. SG200]|uniref:hypothetical protein n=1 Tax=Geothrix sp. SG200 TaxID=2922865 RepID=UPI001FAC7C71|nr:hypothetical protein [Geothrix sp. SG200]